MVDGSARDAENIRFFCAVAWSVIGVALDLIGEYKLLVRDVPEVDLMLGDNAVPLATIVDVSAELSAILLDT